MRRVKFALDTFARRETFAKKVTFAQKINYGGSISNEGKKILMIK